VEVVEVVEVEDAWAGGCGGGCVVGRGCVGAWRSMGESMGELGEWVGVKCACPRVLHLGGGVAGKWGVQWVNG
jgi:hypothetical protein